MMKSFSGDIRDQSYKLSKIAKKFGRFFCRHEFLGAGILNFNFHD